MSGSIYGKIFTISTWGESHGAGVGVCIDGCPSGLELSETDVQTLLDRRRPGQSAFTTQRKESDTVKILSGVFEGKTTGTPISMMVVNEDQHSKDYSALEKVFRPGHADFTFTSKYGIRDHRGGGRSSGRETVARVAAGAVAMKMLKELGIEIHAYATQIAGIDISRDRFDIHEAADNPLCMPDKEAARKCAEYLNELKEKGDSAGGIIECRVDGLKPGIGQPVFDKLDAALAGAVMSIGAVKGFEIGAGFEAAGLTGSQNNEGFYASKTDGGVEKLSQDEGTASGIQTGGMKNISISGKAVRSGGTLGGMSDGGPLIFRAAVKPTPSISVPQETVDSEGRSTELVIHGRHDPVIVPRAVVVVESMAAVTIADLILQDMGSRMDYVKEYYIRK